MVQLFKVAVRKRKIYNKTCSICRKPFKTKYKNKELCSSSCRQEAIRRNSREKMRRKRHGDKRYAPCMVCGFEETTDIHHEGRKTFILCPNHHALITRGIKTINQLLSKEAIRNAPASPKKEEYVTLEDILKM